MHFGRTGKRSDNNLPRTVSFKRKRKRGEVEMTKTEKQDFNFEKSLKELEGLVGQMRKGDLPLDDSLKLFEKGIKLVRTCHNQLDSVEKRVELLLSRTEEDWETKPFEPKN